jgi:hypothetical protein
VIAYRATLDVPRELAQFVSKLLADERRRRGTPRGSRALTCFWQAVLGLRWFRDRTSPETLARDHGISRATAYRYVDEVIAVPADEAPDLRQALERAMQKGYSHVILDETIIPAGRCREKTLSVRGEVIDLWYSGKAHAHGGNIQAMLAPEGVPAVGLGSRTRLGARHHRGSPPRPARPVPGGSGGAAHPGRPGYEGAGIGIHIPVRQPPAGRTSISIAVLATPCSARCAAWGNAGSPWSPAAGAPSSTSPPALARSAPSPAAP